MFTRLIIASVLLTLCGPANAQDVVRYRSRSAKGEWPIHEAKGTIESESLAGITIVGNLIPVRDIFDVEYETPGSIRIDVREARQAEDQRKKVDDAIRRYRALASSSAAASSSHFKRHFDYKAALLLTSKADAGAPELQAAITGLSQCINDHPGGWQRVAATRLLARLYLDQAPPNFDAARKCYEDLAAANGCPAPVKADCQFAIAELHLSQNKPEQALQALATVADDPRTRPYQIVCRNSDVNEVVRQLTELLDKSDDSVKPTIYNLLGDCYRRDPKRQKDALFSYLRVDLVYNHDIAETAKALDQIAVLFKKMGQDERAKSYRDRARGRGQP